MITQKTFPIPTSRLPTAEFADFLQLQVGTTGNVRQEQMLDTSLRAAIVDIEARINKVLLQKDFQFSSTAISNIEIHFGSNDQFKINSLRDFDNNILIDKYRVSILENRTEISLQSEILAENITIFASAGRENWGDIEADLQLAILTLAAFFYEQRSAPTNASRPIMVQSLIEKHRNLRLLRG